MKFAWLTDIHLNFCHDEKIKEFCKKILKEKPDAVVITGDISEAPDLKRHMRLMEQCCGKLPIFFICGNHDYYKGTILGTRQMLTEQFGEKADPDTNNVWWLSDLGVNTLAPGVALIGHDGWYDGLYGNYFDSQLDMQDYYLITELQGPPIMRPVQHEKIKKLSEQAAIHAEVFLPKAFENHDLVYFATHAPPFRESSRAPNGELSDRHWLPHFSSKLLGDALIKVMSEEKHENKKLIVLCGHTHTHWVHEPTRNIKCITGGARYRTPEICTMFFH